MNLAVAASPKYDVFLSFRGEDVRNSFISHLYVALSGKKIEIFKDDAKLKIGDEISPNLRKAIEESVLSVVIFSKNYATSSWCLDELVHILKCNREKKHCILPVFFGVEPSDVRRQKGNYEAAFVELAKRFKSDKLSKWKDALKSTADLVGFTLPATSPESELVDSIVKDVLSKLNRLSPISYDFNKLVGIRGRIRKIQSLLCNVEPRIHIIVIWGMNGIGKTTLASVVYNRLFSQFESSYYLENVSEKSTDAYTLRNKLLAGLLEEDKNTQYLELSFPRTRLQRKKVLVVFDDVSNSDQFDKILLKGSLKFGDKSRIIITTTDLQVVKSIRAFQIYEVKELNANGAFKLFCLNAFEQSFCPTEYKEMSTRVVNTYAKGVPLALEVLGSYLCSKSIREWKSFLHKLERTPHQEIQKKLEVSYDELDEMNQEIFLDIACFLKGEDRDFVESILDGCNFSSHIGITDLINKALITIGQQNKLGMHDLIQKMGQEIVCKRSRKELGKRSRLWDAEDIYQVLATNTGTADVEGIVLDMSKLKKQLDLSPTVFSNMSKLRFLKIHNSAGSINEKCEVKFLESLPRSLVYFHWHGYPLQCLPSNFSPDNLVELSMPWGRVEKLWNSDQSLEKLRRIDLSYCECLTQVPDLSTASNVESINLECCRSLLQVPPGFQNLDKLTSLNLKGCSSLQQLSALPMNVKVLNIQNCTGLESIPTKIYELKSLCTLDLSGCSNLKTFPDIPSSMEPTVNLIELILDRTAIERLPRYIGKLSSIQTLSLDMCKNLVSLPRSISELHCLQSLSLRCCPNLKRLPALPYSQPSVDARGCTSLKTVFSSKAVTEGWNCNHHNCGTFVFYDCRSLDARAQSNIMADALFRIMHMATVTSNYERGQDMTEICWPGNKIPLWFEHNISENSSVNIVLPSHGSDNQTFLGFVFCVVIDFKDCNLHDGDLNIFCQTRCTLPDGFSSSWRWSWTWHWKYCDPDDTDHMHEIAETTLNSPYVFLFYKKMNPRDFGLGNYNHKSFNLTFEFYHEDSNGCVSRRNSRVESCGTRLLYAHDLEKLVSFYEDDEGSVIVDDQEDVESIEEESNEMETTDSGDEDENEQNLEQIQPSSPHLEEVHYNRNSISMSQTICNFHENNLLKKSSGNVNPETSRLRVTSQSAAVQTLPASGHEEVVKRFKELRDQNTRIRRWLSQLSATKSQPRGLLSGLPQENQRGRI